MPQLFSRMDHANWLTPSVADILEQGSAPPGGDGSIRQHILQIQDDLSELGTPARIVNVRPWPSYTLYIARPESVGRLGNRRTITPVEIRRSLGRIAEQHKDWTVGYLPQSDEDQEGVGILLRTEHHNPLSLRRALVRGAFRDHPSSMAVALGVALEQQPVVQDLATTGDLTIIGTGDAKRHLIRSILLTLALLNTPGEIRMTMTGQSAEELNTLAELPHSVGRLLVTPTAGQRLFDGLVKEIQRRQRLFDDENHDNIFAYNASLQEQNRTELPHIVLVVDSLSDPNWQQAAAEWSPSVVELITKGANTGIHLIATANQYDDIPDKVLDVMTTQVVIRSAAPPELSDRLKESHRSALRFIDAFVVNMPKDEVIPVELCTVTDDEIKNAVEYWQRTTTQRKQESQLAEISGRTGVTGILEPMSTLEPVGELPTPPVPEKPSPDTLVRATVALGGDESRSWQKDAQKSDIEKAQALAAYLGWLGIGPLQDILGLSHDEALAMLHGLQAAGILEDTASPTPRFVPLTRKRPD
jgi:DNA segregation ATPase FtsK/SpoIIIE-like protein